MPKREKSAADMLEDAGRVLFDGATDWPSRLSAALKIKKETLRDFRRGHLDIEPDHGLFDDLLGLVSRRAEDAARAAALAAQRAADSAKARDELREWLKKERARGGKPALSRSPAKRSAPRRD